MMRSWYLFVLISGLALFAATPAAWADEYVGQITFSVDDLTFDQREGFDTVSMDQGVFPEEVGAPLIPRYQVRVALPFGAAVTDVRLLDSDIMELRGRYNIMPAAKPLHLGDRPVGNPFQADPSIYERRADYPGFPTELMGQQEVVGQPFAVVALHPLQYNPVTGTLTLATRMRFEVTYQVDEMSIRKTYNFSERTRQRYAQKLGAMAFNPEAVSALPQYQPSGKRALDPGQYEYVLITTSTFASGFQPLLDWRTQMGMHATWVDVAWISTTYHGVDEQEKIRKFVIDAHAEWGATFFLMGGDTNYVPYHIAPMGSDFLPNDTYYADYNDDWNYDVQIGRACVNNTTQLNTFVNKILNYEKSPPGGDFGKTAFFMGFNLDSQTPGEECKKMIKDKWLPPHMVFSREYDSESGGHETDVKNYLKAGKNLVNHVDHASTSFIGTGVGGLSNSEAQAFTNGDKLSNFYTIGCWAGNFESTCWGEAFTLDDQGGITFVGNSRYGWYMPGSYDSLSMMFDLRFWHHVLVMQNPEIGIPFADHQSLTWPYGSTYKYIFKELNLLGDPALHVWTDVPAAMAVTHDASVPAGYQIFMVNAQSGGAPLKMALVCVMKGSEVYACATTDALGNAELVIDPTTTGTLKVTVTANNHLYYEGDVTVLPPAQIPPDITSVSPLCGVEAGSTPLTLEGTDFTLTPAMTVKIGGQDCGNLNVVSPNQLTCTAPANTNGWYDVEVSSSYGSNSLTDAYRYFPVGGLPFNSTDVQTESMDTPTTVTLIVSGLSGEAYAAFYALDDGPVYTDWGDMGLTPPIYPILFASLNSEGYALIPMNLPAGFGPVDFYIHAISYDGGGDAHWAYGGNSGGKAGSIWIHLNN